MKTYRHVLLMTLVLGLLASGSAQAYEIEQQFGVFGAYQDLDDLDEGYGVGLKYMMMFEEVAPKTDLGYDVRGSWLTGNSAGADIDVYPLEFTGLVRWELAPQTKLYMGPGVGYYWFEEDTGAADVDDDIGVYGVIGLEQALTDTLALSVEMKYLYVDSDASGVGAQSVDDVTGFGATIGLAYKW